MIQVRCEHMVVGYTREELDVDGVVAIAHKFPCEKCDASVLIWDNDVNYDPIK